MTSTGQKTWNSESSRTQSGKRASHMYSVPPIRLRPASSRDAASRVHRRSTTIEATAWLESSRELPSHRPAQVRTTVISHRCRKFLEPHTAQYAGSHTASHAAAAQRIRGNAADAWGNVRWLASAPLPAIVVLFAARGKITHTGERQARKALRTRGKSVKAINRDFCSEAVPSAFPLHTAWEPAVSNGNWEGTTC